MSSRLTSTLTLQETHLMPMERAGQQVEQDLPPGPSKFNILEMAVHQLANTC